jgi:Zn finger protein HypA/HybF involved in hydrogenase expression
VPHVGQLPRVVQQELQVPQAVGPETLKLGEPTCNWQQLRRMMLAVSTGTFCVSARQCDKEVAVSIMCENAVRHVEHVHYKCVACKSSGPLCPREQHAFKHACHFLPVARYTAGC